MKVVITEQFYKDIKKFNDQKVRKKIKKTIDKILDSRILSEIPNTRKLKSSNRNYYRVRIGDYRLGFELENNTIFIMKFCHRKDMYKKFP